MNYTLLIWIVKSSTCSSNDVSYTFATTSFAIFSTQLLESTKDLYYVWIK